MSERHYPGCDVQIEIMNRAAEDTGDLDVESDREDGVPGCLGPYQTPVYALPRPACGVIESRTELV